MTLSRRGFLIAATIAPAFAALPALAADTAIEVTLWDNPDMDMSSGLGYGMAGDMSTANMGIKTTKSEVPAGNVTFNVTNSGPDLVHEMVVAPIMKKGQPLPYDAELERVLEDEAGHLGEVAELDPGQKGSLTLELKAGEYILYCNIPGHYSGGMWALLTVK